MSRREKNSLKSHLVILIMHVIKWYSQPWARTGSWIRSIENTRTAIAKILADRPSLIRLVDALIPEACLLAIRKAEKEMGFSPTFTEPTQDDLFDKDYDLKDKK